ncbi:beta-galactosidase [uncultured Robinsoniella sp.]|uniref:beta-galactosidase n=1 Tax=uncultured Robinsoniella sp. TaxID=904190 RepID=UPI00374F3516
MEKQIIYGVQYYRFPTPVKEEWESDIKSIQKHGFNTIKIWAVWRTNQPEEDKYDFDDLDTLMGLATAHGLSVIINIIMDAAPAWLYEKYPECIMEMANGQKLHPQAPLYRQMGGAPGPCYHHKGASEFKYLFIKKLAEHFAENETLLYWDLWNEPELTCGLAREADMSSMVCYCEASVNDFRVWLTEKYGTIDALNQSWKRNYQGFAEIEAPRLGNTYCDMVDWRTFFSETLTDDLRERIRVVKEVDSRHPLMVHTVPIPYFNMINACCDDYKMSKLCDVYGNSIGHEPYMAVMAVCAAGEKTVLSAEIHIVGGESFNRPSVQTFRDFQQQVYTPLAHGIKGFLYWQYRPERCGREGPAWGLTAMDGGNHERLEFASRVGEALKTYGDILVDAKPARGKIVLVRDCKNEIFTWCANDSTDKYMNSILGAFDAFYILNYQVDIKSTDQLLEEGMDSYAMVYYPSPYFMTQSMANALRQFVHGGGMLVSEAFFGAYQGEENLHSEQVPGYGFEEVFGAREGRDLSTASLSAAYGKQWCVENEDKNLIQFTGGLLGVEYSFVGYYFLEELIPDAGTGVGKTPGENPMTMMVTNRYGKGKTVVCGTLLGAAYRASGDKGVLRLFDEFAQLASVDKNAITSQSGVRVDILTCEMGWTVVLRRIDSESGDVSVVLPVTVSPVSNIFVDIDTAEKYILTEQEEIKISLEGNGIKVLVGYRRC